MDDKKEQRGVDLGSLYGNPHRQAGIWGDFTPHVKKHAGRDAVGMKDAVFQASKLIALEDACRRLLHKQVLYLWRRASSRATVGCRKIETR